MTDLEMVFLEAARRRMIFANSEANANGIPVKQSQAIIRRLVKKGLLYRADMTRPNYWGSTYAGYRADRHPDTAPR